MPMNRARRQLLSQRAENMRKQMTPAEKALWFRFLREYPLPFVAQKVIGEYIVDFYCRRVRLSMGIAITGETISDTTRYERCISKRLKSKSFDSPTPTCMKTSKGFAKPYTPRWKSGATICLIRRKLSLPLLESDSTDCFT